MNKIKIAAELLSGIAKDSPDLDAFIVNADKYRIILTPDSERRRGIDTGIFYHMEDVVSICRPLNLSFFIASKVYVDESGNNLATFEVHIY